MEHFCEPEMAVTADATGEATTLACRPWSEVKAVWLLIGSTGAGDALQAFLNYFREPPPAAFVYAQHYDPRRQEHLNELTLENARFSLHLADGLHTLQAGRVLIVPPASKVNITACGQLLPMSEGWSSRYTPDFNQLLAMFSKAGLPAQGVIFLSGMGNDGTSALATMDPPTCRVWAQDPASAVCGAMPQSAIDSGQVQQVGTPVALAAALEQTFMP
jgi:two-component system CheB/CheR fusion protein